tara:strand:+ start:141 stop:671 length:531 start_codon:yes stop_codon:yes gene_type:complete
MSDCSICIEKVDQGFKLDCGHCFHNKCITYWLLENKTCPVCRKSIVEIDEEDEEEDELEETILIMDFFEETIVPKHLQESIKQDSNYEIALFMEDRDEWNMLEPNEYILEMITIKNSKGKYKIKEECRFSINLSIIKNIYCFILTIDSYKSFRKIKKIKDNHIFKPKKNKRTNFRY